MLLSPLHIVAVPLIAAEIAAQVPVPTVTIPVVAAKKVSFLFVAADVVLPCETVGVPKPPMVKVPAV